MTLTRRQFLGAAAGTAALAGLSACSDVHSGGGGAASSTDLPSVSQSAAGSGSAGSTASAGAKASPTAKLSGTVSFAFWGGSTGETAGFTYAKKKFEAANPGTTIEFQVSPYDGFFSGIDRGIQTGKAPDTFRVDYTTIAKYSSRGLLLDMSPYFTTAETQAFLPALWDAVKSNGVPYGVPHQTDTTCIVYDTKAFETAGITSVPDRLEDAWTWEEFADVAAKLRKTLPAAKFPFAYDWTKAGAFRWLSWLYQAGGTLLTPDLKKAAIPSDAATKALDFTKSFFTNKWVPSTGTIKTSQYSDNFFLSQTVPMSFVGDFLVPEIADPKAGYKGDWAATFMPRDKAAAADLGGNAIVARKDSSNPDLAAAWLKFLVQEDAMRYFCEQAIELPTLQSLASAELKYAFRPDVVSVCAKQATTISDTIVKESTVPAFSSINTVLGDQLELAFHDQSTEQTLAALAAAVDKALTS
ncbi:ABC transporter substrate-binding protein [Nakamurella endophytica]|uniref:Sugar ABC transporter substrate-binding protein n=1 Tax=Nakamurella endophytica TaxID=1748367 RepID=A0A917WJ29_9ACTN|nr:sugar ABC transporter substrate-binding protein [Nakamurella endophytica]GGM07114.1 sugar ABC transporter substrate-binding protein [Nakamurella endophytica]